MRDGMKDREELFRATRLIVHTAATPSSQWSAHCLLLASAMRTGLRTNRGHPFRTTLRMRPELTRPLLPKSLEALNYAPGRGSVPSGKGGGL